jgi:hypothetical protein
MLQGAKRCWHLIPPGSTRTRRTTASFISRGTYYLRNKTILYIREVSTHAHGSSIPDRKHKLTSTTNMHAARRQALLIPRGIPLGIHPGGSPWGSPWGSPLGDSPGGSPKGIPLGDPPSGSPLGDPPRGSPSGIPDGDPPGDPPKGSHRGIAQEEPPGGSQSLNLSSL